jgi:hypothetical protein
MHTRLTLVDNGQLIPSHAMGSTKDSLSLRSRALVAQRLRRRVRWVNASYPPDVVDIRKRNHTRDLVQVLNLLSNHPRCLGS